MDAVKTGQTERGIECAKESSIDSPQGKIGAWEMNISFGSMQPTSKVKT
jgi:hypothetical protein